MSQNSAFASAVPNRAYQWIYSSSNKSLPLPFPSPWPVPSVIQNSSQKKAVESSVSNTSEPSDKEKETNLSLPRKLLKKAWRGFVLIKPFMQTFGGLVVALSAKDLFFRLKNPLWTKFKTVLTDHKRDALEMSGQRILASGELFGAINCAAGGFNSDQPGMFLAGLLKVASAINLMFAKSEREKLIAWTFDMFTGVLYTIGYNNEIKNQDPDLPKNKIRRYDMHAMVDRLKAPFLPSSGLSLHRRLLDPLWRPLWELLKMFWFFLGDNAALIQDIWRTRFFLKPENRYPVEERAQFKQKRQEAAKAPLHERLAAWAKNPSLSKSEFAASMFWLGSVPSLITAILKKEHLSNHPVIIILRIMGQIVANLPTLSIALNRHDLLGRTPLVGVPLNLFGTHVGKTINIGIGNIGGGIGDFFYSDVAVRGVQAREKKEHEVIKAVEADVRKVEQSLEHPFRHLQPEKSTTR